MRAIGYRYIHLIVTFLIAIYCNFGSSTMLKMFKARFVVNVFLFCTHFLSENLRYSRCTHYPADTEVDVTSDTFADF